MFDGYDDECKNEKHIHDDIDTILLLMLVFPDDIYCLKTIFNSSCSEKLKKMLIKSSLIDIKLYFFAIQKLKQLILNIYIKILNHQLIKQMKMDFFLLMIYVA